MLELGLITLCSIASVPSPPPLPTLTPKCGSPPSQLSTSAIFHVLPGTEPRGPALCKSQSTNAVVLKAQCVATPGCVAFTVGSGGGEAGDLPPHDCRGSQLYGRAAIPDDIATMAKAGVDLFVLGPASPRNISTVTPKPKLTSFPQRTATFEINRSTFKISVAEGSTTNGVLTDALRRYEEQDAFIGAEPRNDRASSMAAAGCDKLLVHVEDASATLTPSVDESYNLTIAAGASRLRAGTVWGALRGLETFAQLLFRGMPPPGSASAPTDSAYFVDEQIIVDEPYYSYRGLMVDTARHFIPLRMLFAIVDGMVVEKLNVLHWHAVDDQSFPLEVQSLPRLAPAAQFGPAHRYSVENITALVAYGRSRGVRVMLEIDTPGHCQVLQRAYPELGLITECAGTTCWPPLDVSKNSSLEFVRSMWRDLVPLFPDGDVFIGGDECHTQCWAANAQVAAWAKANNLQVEGSGEGSIFAWYVDQIVATVHGELGKRPNMWSPLFWDPASPPKQLVESRAVLNLWTGNITALAFNMTKSNASVVTSFGWYLDGAPPKASVYSVDPASYCEVDPAKPNYCPPHQRARIIGGEACMWGESVDLANFFTTVWPSLTLIAEKLWSGPSPQGGLDLLDGRKRRLRRQRCRLVSRGLPVPIITSGIYVPDASHASFATWRDYQWCPGDEHWGAAGESAQDIGIAATRGAHWAKMALEAAGAARARPLTMPFDS